MKDVLQLLEYGKPCHLNADGKENKPKIRGYTNLRGLMTIHAIVKLNSGKKNT